MSDHTLYLDIETFDVYLDPGTSYFESFIPSLDFSKGQQGFLVIVVNGQYDSNGPSGSNKEVIDAYLSLAEAKQVAEAITSHNRELRDLEMDWKRRGKIDPPLLDIKYADGTAYRRNKNPPWIGWGNNLEEVIVCRFTVDETPKVMRFY